MKKFFLRGGIAVALVVFSGCSLFGRDLSPEAALPLENQMVIAIDYSNGGQVDNIKGVMDTFPDMGILKRFGDEILNADFLSNLKDMGLDYEKDIKPIFEDDWKIAISYNKGEDDVPDLVISAKFSEADKLEEVMDKSNEKNKDSIVEQKGDAKYWNSASGSSLAKYGDIFVMAQKKVAVEEAVSRMEKGEKSFADNESFLAKQKKFGNENLGYAFVDMKKMASLVNSSVDESSIVPSSVKNMTNVEQMKLFDDIYMIFKADDDGMGLYMDMGVDGENPLFAQLFPSVNYKLALMDKVPGEGVILYFEEPDAGKTIASFVVGFVEGFNAGLSGEEAPETESLKTPEQMQEKFNIMVSDFAGITKEDAEAVFGSPVAVLVSDVGEIYPTVSLYFMLNEKTLDAGKKISLALDKYADSVIKEFDAMVTADPSLFAKAGLIKKDVSVANGGGLHKLYLDWSMIDEAALASFNTVPDFKIKDTKVEVHYGVTGDNVLVVALYPEFDKAYGGDSLANNKEYKKVVEGIEDSYGYGVFYMSPVGLQRLSNKYLEILKSLGFVSESYLEDISVYKKAILTVKSMIFSAKVEGNNVNASGYVKVEEVKEEEGGNKLENK